MLNEPVSAEQFFGRKDILSVVEKRVNALKDGYRQNIALTGQSLSGKSSIIHHLLYNLKDEKIIAVYIELIEEGFDKFSHKFIGSLLYNFLKGIGQPVKEDLEFLISEAKKYIPHTVSAIDRIRDPLQKMTREQAYSELFNLTSFIKEETHKSCIIIFDEFHNLGALGLKNPFAIFGKKIMVQKDTMYIVTSSRVSSVKKILSEKLSLLFGNFEAIEVSGFDLKTAQSFLEERLKSIRVPDEYKEFLISFTDSNPFYLDVVSQRLKQLGERFTFKRISEETLIQAFHECFFDFKGTVNQYLSNYLETVFDKKKGYEKHLPYLTALSENLKKLPEIAGFVKKKPREAARFLNELAEMDIVTKTGTFYLLSDRMLGFWLKHVYQKKRSSIISYMPERAKDFKELMRTTLNEYTAESKKDLSQKVQEILKSFNNDSVQIEYKSYTLSRLADVKMEEFENKRPFLKGAAKGKPWVVYIKEGLLQDIDIIEFTDQVKALKEPVARKIIVAPFGVDANASLLAKDEKIWIWDMEALNLFMSIYDKPRLVKIQIKGKKKQ